MSSVNTNVVVLTGRLTRDPKLYEQEDTEAQGEPAYTILHVAINRGDDLDPIYYDVKCWKGLARACVEYQRKGSLVAVTGRLDQFKKDDGNPWNYITAESVEFIGGRRRDGGDE
jgi:single-stranded DNA-binding protein